MNIFNIMTQGKIIAVTSLLLALFLTSTVSFAQKRVLYIGDSITDGAWGQPKKWNSSSQERNQTDYNHIFGHGYMMISAATLMADYPGEYECFNRGISGNTLEDLRNRWQEDAISLKPDYISILIGTNDVDRYLYNTKHPFDVKAWENMLATLIDDTRKQLPDTRFILCTPFVAKVGKRGEEENFALRSKLVNQCAKAVKRVAKKSGAAVVPFNELFATLTKPSLDYWCWDGIHPTPAAHKKMADLWMKVMLQTVQPLNSRNQ